MLFFIALLNISAFSQPLDPEREEFMKEWDEKMRGFIPDDIVIFEVSSNSVTDFYELLEAVPLNVTGTWFLRNDNTKELDFQVFDPEKKNVVFIEGKRQGIFKFEATLPGIYLFQFVNKRLLSSQEVVYTYSTGNLGAVVPSSHITPLEFLILNIQDAVKNFKLDSQFGFIQQESYFNKISSTNFNLFLLSYVESLLIVGLTIWQVYYIKKLLDNRKIF